MSACLGNNVCSFSSSAVRFEPLYHHHSKNLLLNQRASGAGSLHPGMTWVICQTRSTTDRGRGHVSVWSATTSFSSYPSPAFQGRTRICIWSCASTPMAKCLRLRVVARTIQAEGISIDRQAGRVRQPLLANLPHRHVIGGGAASSCSGRSPAATAGSSKATTAVRI